MIEKNKKKKKIILTVIAVITLLTVVIGATFAFFTAQTGTGKSASIKVDTATTDSLKFEDGKTLTINATQQNFGKGAGNESDDTTVKATLVANNNTNQASENYYVYLDITANQLKYTTEDKQAELLLQVTGPAGEVKTIPGLNYVTSGGESGFDITEAQDLITIADQYLIEATGTEEQTWTIKIVLVNLDSNQQGNTEKAFIANVKIQKGKYQTEMEIACSGQNMATCMKENHTLDTNLLLHDASLANGAGDNNLRYSGANPRNYVCFGSDAATCPEDNLYRIIGIYGDQVKLIKSEAATSTLLGKDGDFGSEMEITTEMLDTAPDYIKQQYKAGDKLTNYYWNNNEGHNSTNEWSKSRLNTVNLNTNYINNIGNTWAEKIATTTWQVGGVTEDSGKKSNAKTVYDYEVGANKANTTYEAKIGLMYLSDYYYAANKEYWTLPGYDETGEMNENNEWIGNDYSKTLNDNWILPIGEWTLSRYSDFLDCASIVYIDGTANINNVINNIAVRPVFYLNSTVNYVSGSGMANDPIRIS